MKLAENNDNLQAAITADLIEQNDDMILYEGRRITPLPVVHSSHASKRKR